MPVQFFFFLHGSNSGHTDLLLHYILILLNLDLIKTGRREINNSPAKPLRALRTPSLPGFFLLFSYLPAQLRIPATQWQTLTQKCTDTSDQSRFFAPTPSLRAGKGGGGGELAQLKNV